jgi:DNA-directed RNA polymerase specialized sigma24 family protein
MSNEIEAFYAAATAVTRQVREHHAADFDDMVQEAVIAAWRTADRAGGDRKAYGRVVAARRVRKLASPTPARYVGATSGKTYDLHHQAGPLMSTDEGRAHDDHAASVALRVDLERLLSVRDAKILAGVVGGFSWEEIAEQVGMTKVSVRNRWVRNVRPDLRVALKNGD